jgi:HAD domain in Swiss Army Knife RNA repair proteins
LPADPVIFIDVDGVLNPEDPHEDNRVVLAKPEGSAWTFPLNLSARQGRLLTALARETGAEIVWCSTWQQDANEWVGSRIELPPELPHLRLEPARFSETLGAVKARTAAAYAGRRRFVIFDDEPEIGSCLPGDADGLHVYVDPRSGLLPEHIAAAREFLSC